MLPRIPVWKGASAAAVETFCECSLVRPDSRALNGKHNIGSWVLMYEQLPQAASPEGLEILMPWLLRT